MYCSQCGTESLAEDKFCTECGNSLNLSETIPKSSEEIDAQEEVSDYWAQRRNWKRKLFFLFIFGIIIFALIFLFTDSNNTCESIVDDVVNLSKDEAPWIHQIYNIQEWSRTNNQTFLCIGVAQMSSGVEFDIQFYSELDTEGTIWIGYEERSVGVIEIGR